MVSIDESLRLYSRGVGMDLDPIDQPVHLIIAHALFKIANTVNPKKRSSLREATAAQKIILDRMVGKRLPGSNPAAQGGIAVSFVDLTKAVIGGETDAGDGEDTQVP